MNTKKILIVFGTRPEAIKMAPLVKEFRDRAEDYHTSVCVTGQHREMLDQVLALFDIVPEYDLNIMRPGQDLFDVTTNVLSGIRGVLADAKPDLVFVHGDTTTSFATALAAFYSRVRTAHVEAGLRTYNLEAPWPEEANRQLTARLSTYHFAPTERARSSLLSEHVHPASILVTGNTVIDALHWVLNRNKKGDGDEGSRRSIRESGYCITDRDYILVTGHRRENFGDGFRNICTAIAKTAREFPDTDVVYPVHMNPNVRSVVFDNLSGLPNVYLIEPLGYAPFSHLMSRCKIVLTDSGGVQEEAPSLGKPVLVMRDRTERPEALQAGTVKLVGTDVERITSSIRTLLTNSNEYAKMAQARNPYGDGKACARIVDFVASQP